MTAEPVTLGKYIREIKERVLDRPVEVLSVTNTHGFKKQSEHFSRTVHSKKLGSYRYVRRGQFAYNPSRINVGSIALLKEYDEGALSPMYIVFETDKSKLLPEYFDYFRQTHDFRNMVKQNTAGTVRDSLSYDALTRFRLYLPPIDKQVKIASILSEVDSLSQKTDQVIHESERLKKGLMQQLLTVCLDHKTTRNTTINSLPDSWTVARLDDVAKRGSGHTPDKKVPDYYSGGIKWISLGDTNKFDLGLISETKIEISQLGIDRSSAVLHQPGSVVLSRDAGVGKSAIMNDAMAVSQHFMVWTCGDKLYNWFLYYYLQSKKSEFERVATGSTIKTIGLPYFKAMMIPLPPLTEQRRIANGLRAVDEKIAVSRKLKAKQQELKKGLMQDLLSGKISV